MNTYTPNPPLFGINIDPSVDHVESAFALARIADDIGLDFITVQDHPYNPVFLDTWTLLAALGMATERVHLLPNVLNLPLRPPAMLAKAAASLDILTGGRVEMALGAGARFDAVAAYGGPRRDPGEAVDALEEALHIMRALWDGAGNGPVRFEGEHYQLEGAQPGPAPAHRIRIWLGALKPRMLRLTGQLAGGLLISSTYIPPGQVPAIQQTVDEVASSAGRSANEIRRGYNLMGTIVTGEGPAMTPRREGIIIGTVDHWVNALVDYHRRLRLDTFNFWPITQNVEVQARLFAEQVAPAVRDALGTVANV